MQNKDCRTFYLTLAFLFMGFAACENRPPAREEVPQPRVAEVKVRVLQTQPWGETISSFGIIDAAKEIVITYFQTQPQTAIVEHGDSVSLMFADTGVQVGHGMLPVGRYRLQD